MSSNNRLTRRDALRLFGAVSAGALALGNSVQATFGQASQTAASDYMQGAGFYRFKLGEMDCTVVNDGVIKTKPNEFFINPPDMIARLLREQFLPTDELTLHVNTLVVHSGKRIALMDTGIGNTLGPMAGHLFTNLKRAGYTPGSITDVFISHTHFDHIGGNYDAAGHLNFPNATFHLSKKEWTISNAKENYLTQAKIPDGMKNMLLDAIKQNIAPLKDRVKLFDTDTEVLPGISSLQAYGHTPGHSTYLIRSGGDSLLYAGDMLHHLIQLLDPRVQMNGNFAVDAATDIRQKILTRVAAEKMKMMTAHFPFPGIGNLRSRGTKENSYEWVTADWQW